MRFNATTAIFLTACVVAVVGSQIQAKILANLFNTPLLAAWIVCIFLWLFGPVQWLCVFQDQPAEPKRQQFSRLLMIVLQMADISTFFIAINFSSVRVIAGMQVNKNEGKFVLTSFF